MKDPNPQKKSNNAVAIFMALLLVGLMWISFLIDQEFDLGLSKYGLYPRSLKGLKGIFTIPFIHGSWSHLINNTFPMLVLVWALFKFYRSIAFKSFIGIYIISGVWLWISGRASFHIGASGLVYGIASFLFLSGWLRREKRVAALSLLVAFLYGSMWWGVLPVDPTISWEGHLWGALAGFALAFLYRKEGPQKPVYDWEMEEQEEARSDEEAGPDLDRIEINYTIIPAERDKGRDSN